MNTNDRHMCGHQPLNATADTSITFCAKCVAWNCQTVNCPGHQRMPEAGEVQSMNWTRNADGSYAREGWTIRRAHSKGSGQSRPFEHVSTKAHDYWEVLNPQGHRSVSGRLLKSAKINADRQIAIRASKENN